MKYKNNVRSILELLQPTQQLLKKMKDEADSDKQENITSRFEERLIEFEENWEELQPTLEKNNKNPDIKDNEEYVVV